MAEYLAFISSCLFVSQSINRGGLGKLNIHRRQCKTGCEAKCHNTHTRYSNILLIVETFGWYIEEIRFEAHSLEKRQTFSTTEERTRGRKKEKKKEAIAKCFLCLELNSIELY